MDSEDEELGGGLVQEGFVLFVRGMNVVSGDRRIGGVGVGLVGGGHDDG